MDATQWEAKLEEYQALMLYLKRLQKSAQPVQASELSRHLARTDLYFLLRYVLGRMDVEHPWLYQRIKEVEESPDGHLDLWSREHYKSTIITSALSIRDVLRSHGKGALETPEACIGIFSHTRPIAKSFMRQIKREFEANDLLKGLFPDIFWSNARAEAPLWSEDSGITVKRKHNRREATIEAWGLVDGQPTSKHYTHMVYDDVVTQQSVTTSEMIYKTTEAWELSTNLEAVPCRRRMIGTRYHNVDTYRTLMDRGVVKPRIYPATDDGTFQGNPVFWPMDVWKKKAHEQGPKSAATQLLQNPREGAEFTFERTDLRYFDDVGNAQTMNRYIIVDPANVKSKRSDFTSIVVLGAGSDRNYYLLDAIRDKLNLEERITTLLDLQKLWRPDRVGYERFGMQADIEHLKFRQEQINYRFDVVELKGKLGKADRIERLLPVVTQHRLYLPRELIRMDWQGRRRDIIEDFLVQEYDLWPVPEHDDMLDSLARILDADLNVTWPKGGMEDERNLDRYERAKLKRKPGHTRWRSL